METPFTPEATAPPVALNPIISVTFHSKAGEPVPHDIPAQFGEELTRLVLGFMADKLQQASDAAAETQQQLDEVQAVLNQTITAQA